MASVYKSISKQKANGQANGDDAASKRPRNRQKVLMLTSRGVTYRCALPPSPTPSPPPLTLPDHSHRHLLADLHALLPHSRKDAKLDTKTHLAQLNELADLYSCNNILFCEARKAQDLYIWLAKPPNGPTLKLHAQNIHTMEELNFTGNCLKGSRAILSFDAAFDAQAHWRLVKELLTHVFGVPEGARKAKPFVDHVMGFTLADGKIWVRCYEIGETEGGKAGAAAAEEEERAGEKVSRGGETSLALTEIGPRFVLTPIVILEGSFGGPVIYENKEFVSPNQIRSDLRKAKAGRYNRRAEGTVERKAKKRDLGLRTGEGVRRVDEMDERVLFA